MIMSKLFNLEMSKDNPFYDSFKLMSDQINDFESISRAETEKPMIKIDTELKPGLIDLDTLNSVTNGLQNAFTSAMNMVHGNGSDTSRIRKLFRDETKLVITGVDKGSFIIHLSTLNDVTQDSIDLESKIEQEEYFTVLNDLFSSFDKKDSSKYIKEHYGLRTLKYTKEWFTNMSTNEVSFKYKPADQNTFQYFETARIKDVSRKLSVNITEEKESDVTIKGRLTGVNVIKKTLTFLLEDLNEIDVHVSNDSLSHNKVVINKEYEVSIREIKRISNYTEYISYIIPTIVDTPLVLNDDN